LILLRKPTEKFKIWLESDKNISHFTRIPRYVSLLPAILNRQISALSEWHGICCWHSRESTNISHTFHAVTVGLATLCGETACIAAAGFVNSKTVLEMDVRPVRKIALNPYVKSILHMRSTWPLWVNLITHITLRESELRKYCHGQKCENKK